MSKKDDGGSAFAHGNPTYSGSQGMTLRDWFAGQALAGAIEDCEYYEPRSEGSAEANAFGSREDIVARQAYRYADALLAARKGEE